MEINEILVISMFLTFIVFLFTGIPIAYVLAGVGIIFGGIGYRQICIWILLPDSI